MSCHICRYESKFDEFMSAFPSRHASAAVNGKPALRLRDALNLRMYE
jgi:hypothetical protein